MPPTGKSIQFTVSLNDQGVVQGFKQIGVAGQQASKQVESAFGSLGGLSKMIGVGGGAAGFGYLAKQAIDIADQWQLVEGRLRIVTSSAEQLRTVQSSLFDLAQETRQTYATTADMFSRIARSTRDLNATDADRLQVIKSINEAIIVSGASTQEADAAVIQLGQALASGALRGDELRSVMEETPRIAQAIADGLGVSLGQLREMGKEGKLTTTLVFKALQSQAGKIGEEFAKMPKTVGQGLTQMSNVLGEAINEINQASGASASMGNGLSEAADYLRLMIPLGIQLVGTLQTMATAAGAVSEFFFGDLDLMRTLSREQIDAYKQIEVLQQRMEQKSANKTRPATIDAEAAKKEAQDIAKMQEEVSNKMRQLAGDDYAIKKYFLGLEVADLWTKAKASRDVQDQVLAYGLAAQLKIEQAETESTRKLTAGKLGEWQKYYDDLQAKIKENHDLEYKSIQDINNLIAQRYSTRRSTEGMLGDLGGQQMAAKDQYNLSRSQLKQQLDSISMLTGQDKIKALEDYKKNVHDLAIEFQGGIEGNRITSGISGDTIFAQARDDIQAAWTAQQQTMTDLQAGYEKQQTAAKQWGDVLTASAIEANNQIVWLQGTLVELDQTLANMTKAITITITTNHVDTYSGYGGGQGQDNSYGGGSGFNQTTDFSGINSYAVGTDWVPKTGLAIIHQGEAIIPAAQNKAGASRGLTINGGMTFNLPQPSSGSALPNGSDLDRWTRDQFIPALKRAGAHV